MRRGLRLFALAGLVGGLGLAVSGSPIGFGLEEEWGLPGLFALRGIRPAPNEALVVRFDRDTLARLRALPADPDDWPEPLRACAARHGGVERLGDATSLERLPRVVQACLVEELTRRGAAVIAFDIAFRPDPSRETGVPAFAEAVGRHGAVILLERAVREWLPATRGQSTTNALQTEVLEGPHEALAQAAIATAPWVLPRGSEQVHQFWAFNPALPSPVQLPARALEVLALPALGRLAASTGQPLAAAGTPAEMLARRTGWFRAQAAAHDGGISEFELAGLTADDARTLAALQHVYRGANGYYLNFYGPSGTFPSLSAADLLIPEPGHATSPVDLNGRAVFVGWQELTVPQAPDSYPTAFRSREGVDLSGVEIAATAFGNLLHGETLRGPPEWARLAMVALLGFTLTLASCFGTVWRGVAATLTLAATYAAGVAASFVLWNFWLPIAVPLLLVLPLAVLAGQVVHYLGAARWLGVYAPRQVTRQLLQGHEREASRPRRLEVTVMITDIADFTSLAEHSTPEAVTEFVTGHFTLLNRCVEAEGGTAAQFIGDGMMAFWGAPDPQPDHAARACRAALAIAASIEDANARPNARLPTRLRIGINTGLVTVGNVGAPGRSNYGIVGDTVNTTQRIEQLAKQICTDDATVTVLVSARTRAQAGGGLTFDDAGAHPVKGRQEPVPIFRLDTSRPASSVRPGRPASLAARYG